MSATAWKSILVAVRDPGQRRPLAIGKAARLAAATGARVTLFHAFSLPWPPPEPLPADPEAILRAVAKDRRAALEKQARPLRAAGLKVSCEVAWDFPPAQAIVRRALASRPDLVVAESHRHSALARWFLASADWDLIRECPCPVWFVKRDRLARRPVLLTAVDPSHAHAKPSGLDDRLLATAAAVGADTGGHLAMLHVEDVTATLPPAFLPALPPQALQPAPAAQAKTRAAVARLARRHGVPAEAALVIRGVPAEAIPDAAARLGADVLVMGAVSRRGLASAFIGHTAESVIDAVKCDVLVVKPRGFRTSVPRRAPKLPR